jgi:hypothetical protein
MKNTTENSSRLSKTEEKINLHFEYLFQRGFIITSREYRPEYMGYWKITLLSSNYAIEIDYDRGEIGMAIGSIKMDKWIGLATVVYYVTNGNEFIGLFEGDLRDEDAQFSRLAKILKIHIEKITEVFQDFKKHESSLLLLVSGKIIDKLIIEKYSNRNKSQM